MSDDVWISIPNWERFQHYKDRTPPWIKVYLELRDRESWVELNDAQRGLLVRLWLEFAAHRGPCKASEVRPKRGARHFQGNLEALNHAGYIELSASKALALSRARARARVREEVLREELRPASKTDANPTAGNGELEPAGTAVDDEMLRLAKGWLQAHRPGHEPEPGWTATEDEPF